MLDANDLESLSIQKSWIDRKFIYESLSLHKDFPPNGYDSSRLKLCNRCKVEDRVFAWEKSA